MGLVRGVLIVSAIVVLLALTMTPSADCLPFDLPDPE